MGKILAFCGVAQSGKNTLSNFLHGCQLKSYGVIHNFKLLNSGDLIAETKDEDGKVREGKIDVTRTDFDFASWAIDNMWPLVKNYSFAGYLKEIGISLFGIPREYAYGTDEQKRIPLDHLRWENMPGVITPSDIKGLEFDGKSLNEYNLKDLRLVYHEPGPMSTREWLQFFGTEVARKMYDQVWVNRTLTDIKNEESQLAIISDCRFLNECEGISNAGGKIIKLTRGLNSERRMSHASENDFEKFTKFDAVLDNANMSIEESCVELMKILNTWGWTG